MKKHFILGVLTGAVLFGAITAVAVEVAVEPNRFPIQVNGQTVHIEGYNINDYSYFKLRDVASAVGGFDVDFAGNTIQLSKDGYVYDNSSVQNNVSEEKKREFQAKAAEIENDKEEQLSDIYVTSDINDVLNATYEKWDALLNEVYQYLKATLPNDEFSALQNDEIAWMAQRDNAMNEAAASGGTMGMLDWNSIRIEYTSERCHYLISLIK